MCALFRVSSKRLFSAPNSVSSLSLRRFCSTLTSIGFVHPTAIVHPIAVLGEGVSVGPFCTIGSSVKVGNGCRLHPGSHIFGSTVVGDSCVLMTGAIVGDDVPGRTVLGCNNVIGHHALVGVKCQDLKYKGMNASLMLGTTMRSESMPQSTDLRSLVIQQFVDMLIIEATSADAPEHSPQKPLEDPNNNL